MTTRHDRAWGLASPAAPQGSAAHSGAGAAPDAGAGTPAATEVVFYEKPGCLTNVRQKQLLVRHGHRLLVRNLLRETWTAARLRAFFGTLPVADWFNPSAPRVRSGEIDPATLDADGALALMLAEPLLIRRPLLDTPFGRCAGFEPGPVLAALGVALPGDDDMQSCSRPKTGSGSVDAAREPVDGAAVGAAGCEPPPPTGRECQTGVQC